jgi:hypothetical protein
MLLGCAAKQAVVTNMQKPPQRILSQLPKGCQFEKNGSTVAVFISNYYGFRELWMLFNEAAHGWHKPLYLAQPVLANIPYFWSFKNDTLLIKITAAERSLGLYQVRKPFLAFVDSSRLAMKQILQDTDADGLTDYCEEVLWTDAVNPDTDGDGIDDGLDANPFADDSLHLTHHEHLHRQIIETELRALESDELAVVEQPGKRAIPYSRRSGIVLCMPAGKVDDYIATQGYGIPVLSAAIKDTLQYHKVDFTFFITPDSAWGFEALYALNKKRTAWKKKNQLKEWGVMP